MPPFQSSDLVLAVLRLPFPWCGIACIAAFCSLSSSRAACIAAYCPFIQLMGSLFIAGRPCLLSLCWASVVDASTAGHFVSLSNFCSKLHAWVAGKLNRGLSVVDSAAALVSSKGNGASLTEEQRFQAAVLGWCIEWVSPCSGAASTLSESAGGHCCGPHSYVLHRMCPSSESPPWVC